METNFLHKNVCERLTFAMIMKKVDTSFFGGDKGAKISDFGAILGFKPLFCQSLPTNPTKLAEKVCFGVLQHLTKFQANILTEKFYLRIKSKYPPGGQAVFRLYF